MRTVIKKFASVFVRIFHFMFNYNTVQRVKNIKCLFYSKWISFEFKKFGKHSFVGKNLTLEGGKYIEIGVNCLINRNVVLTAWDKYGDDCFNPRINIGNDVHLGEYSHITAINKILIGNSVLTGKWVTITDNSHGKTDHESFLLPPVKRKLYSPGSVIIEDNVWIGDKVTILPNVHIGKNVVIGANTIVNRDIPANSVAVGNPVRIIKTING